MGGYRTFGGVPRSQISPGADRRSVTVTFDYGGDLRTIVAPSRKAAFAEASARWGWGWDGEPVVSSPDTIYDDLTGWTAAQHGQNFTSGDAKVRRRDSYRRTGRSYYKRG
jgi:hypothetical protein